MGGWSYATCFVPMPIGLAESASQIDPQRETKDKNQTEHCQQESAQNGSGTPIRNGVISTYDSGALLANWTTQILPAVYACPPLSGAT